MPAIYFKMCPKEGVGTEGTVTCKDGEASQSKRLNASSGTLVAGIWDSLQNTSCIAVHLKLFIGGV